MPQNPTLDVNGSLYIRVARYTIVRCLLIFSYGRYTTTKQLFFYCSLDLVPTYTLQKPNPQNIVDLSTKLYRRKFGLKPTLCLCRYRPSFSLPKLAFILDFETEVPNENENSTIERLPK